MTPRLMYGTLRKQILASQRMGGPSTPPFPHSASSERIVCPSFRGFFPPGCRHFGTGVKVQRGQYGSLTQTHIDFFCDTLGSHGLLLGGKGDDVTKYTEDWLGSIQSNAGQPHGSCVLRPKSTLEVSQILKYCQEHKLAVVPQGGNTGLVGGSVPLFDEIVLSLERMNQVLEVNEDAGTVVLEAGAVLEAVNNRLEQHQMIFPLDLGAKGSATVGGLVSTNAAGIRFLRYGSLKGSCLGLEFVMADGRVVDLISKGGGQCKKDNTGYDLKQLMIGSEGTLGVVTKACVQCPPAPRCKNLLLVAVPTFKKCVDLYRAARQELGEILSAFEFFEDVCLQVVKKNLSDSAGQQIPEFLLKKMEASGEAKTDPLREPAFYGVLIETSSSQEAGSDVDQMRLLEFLNRQDLLEEGVVATSEQQFQQLWSIREEMPSAMMQEGQMYTWDIGVSRLEDLQIVCKLVRKRLADHFDPKKIASVTNFGHMGDGNLHLCVNTYEKDSEINECLEKWLWELVGANSSSSTRSEHPVRPGSISAEHGMGSFKPYDIHYAKPDEAVKLMHQIKNIFDPSGILNPYKVLPSK